MIEFEKIKEEETLKFRDVEQDQFFMDKDNSVCQKVLIDAYNILAIKDGSLFSSSVFDVNKDMAVEKIFPTGSKLVKIIIE